MITKEDYLKAQKVVDQYREQLEQALVNGQLLSVPYLMEMHPEINDDQAERLLKFCKEHTIRHKECYGDGSIMYPKWKESNCH